GEAVEVDVVTTVALLAKHRDGAVDHRRRAAEERVGARLEQALDLLGDETPLPRPRRVVTRGREHRDEAERAAPLPRDRLDLFEGIEVPRLARAEEQRGRPRDAG